MNIERRQHNHKFLSHVIKVSVGMWFVLRCFGSIQLSRFSVRYDRGRKWIFTDIMLMSYAWLYYIQVWWNWKWTDHFHLIMIIIRLCNDWCRMKCRIKQMPTKILIRDMLHWKWKLSGPLIFLFQRCHLIQWVCLHTSDFMRFAAGQSLCLVWGCWHEL